jgi:protein ImuA
MIAVAKTLSALRRSLADLGPPLSAQTAKISFGMPTLDGALGGGLARAALHEIFAAQFGDATAAACFVVGLAARTDQRRKILWVRHELASLEAGNVHPSGLVELGIDPNRFILVRVRDPLSALRAGNEGARCPALAAVITEIWNEPRALDLTATRRLSLAASRSGVTVFLLRTGATARASTAATRWSVRSVASSPLPAEAPGHPVFELTLLRHRWGISPRSWRVEWNRDESRFQEPSALSRALAFVPADRPAAEREEKRIARRVG